ncbi:Bestrophin, RFP-TM, chloride channel-domain-containing protein [Irpex lacteus]|nr:Bestrophin, RFP-TM, chloride channel-domain-containing protein [Irpex lacteus]
MTMLERQRFQVTRFYYQRFRTTVINDIWPEMLFFTLVSVMVVLVSELTHTSLAVSNVMLTVLGTILGLVISFRTTTAYERYTLVFTYLYKASPWSPLAPIRFSEGRKLWTTLAMGSRNLAQIIWIHVPFECDDPPEGTNEKQSDLRAVIEKKSMISLVHAYSISVKHLLRGEPGAYYEDLFPLISFLPRFSTLDEAGTEHDILPLWRSSAMDYATYRRMSNGSDSTTPASEKLEENYQQLEECSKPVYWQKRKASDLEALLPDVPSENSLLPSRIPPHYNILHYIPFLRGMVPRVRDDFDIHTDPSKNGRTATGKKIRPKVADSNVPMEILLFISSYFMSLMKRKQLTPASATAMNNAIVSLQDAVANLERIKDTPLPFAYQAHLRMSVWLYLLLLPFQIEGALTWVTIPATAFTSFLLLGFLEIGQEIENPFDYELNDLDLDKFCLIIGRDLHEITAHPIPDPHSFIFSQWNQPFAPADRANAKAIVDDNEHPYHASETGTHQVRRTLLKSWHEVNEKTRPGLSSWK